MTSQLEEIKKQIDAKESSELIHKTPSDISFEDTKNISTEYKVQLIRYSAGNIIQD